MIDKILSEGCPLPWVEQGQKHMLVLSTDGEVAHVARVAEWKYEGTGTALCGAEVVWSGAIDEQTSDERPCAQCMVLAAG